MYVMSPIEKRESALITPTPPEAFSTWHDLAGHWLRNPAGKTQEGEALARRLAALQRWRGLAPEAGPSF
jgi:hypothetical protein